MVQELQLHPDLCILLLETLAQMISKFLSVGNQFHHQRILAHLRFLATVSNGTMAQMKKLGFSSKAICQTLCKQVSFNRMLFEEQFISSDFKRKTSTDGAHIALLCQLQQLEFLSKFLSQLQLPRAKIQQSLGLNLMTIQI